MEIIIKLKGKKIILKQKFFENLSIIFGVLAITGITILAMIKSGIFILY